MTVAGPQSLRRLLDAVVAVGSGLEVPTLLHRITELAVDLVDARYGALGVLDEARTGLSQFVVVGLDDATRAAIGELPKGHGILGLLIVEAKPIRLPNLQEHPDSYGFPPNHPPMTSFLGVPILVRGEVFGNLYLTEKTTAEVFTDIDEELAVGLATAAGVALENARLHALVAEMALVEDRERIARDLHDTVVQRLFATSLSLQAAGPLIRSDPESASGRIEAAIDALDETIKTIRSAIFALERGRPRSGDLRSEILDVCRRASPALGFEPAAVFDGPVDAATVDEVGADLVATLREALANVARHAQARSVWVAVTAHDGQLTLDVADDGKGLQGLRRGGHGLANMEERANRHGGMFDVGPRRPVGTALKWRVPID